MQENCHKIFPGCDQVGRFRKLISTFLDTPAAATSLASFGLTATDLGSHSIRKGAITYCFSGVNPPPASSESVSIRCGWKMPGVEDIYVKYQSVGDELVGRLVSGLPAMSSDFVTLPPFFLHSPLNSPSMFFHPSSRLFSSDLAEVIKRALETCFPGYCDKCPRIAEFALASLVKHAQWIRDTLPKKHPVFHSGLFSSKGLLKELAPLVVCRIEMPGDPMHTTGASAVAVMLKKNQEIESAVANLSDTVKNSILTIIAAFKSEIQRQLDSRGVGTTAQVTQEKFHEEMQSIVKATGIEEAVARLNAFLNAAQPVHPVPTPDAQPVWPFLIQFTSFPTSCF